MRKQQARTPSPKPRQHKKNKAQPAQNKKPLVATRSRLNTPPNTVSPKKQSKKSISPKIILSKKHPQTKTPSKKSNPRSPKLHHKPEDKQQGVFKSARGGFGFITPTHGAGDWFVPFKYVEGAMDGDTVAFEPIPDKTPQGKKARVTKILERKSHLVVGRVKLQEKGWVLEPSDPRGQFRIPLVLLGVPPPHIQDGDYASAKITVWPENWNPGQAQWEKRLGKETDPNIEIEIALRRHALPDVFSPAILKKVAQIPLKISKDEQQEYRDLRPLPLLTIDGEDARDFDDAVWCESVKGNAPIRLIVAIADVSHYVKPNTLLDTAAKERGTSVYFPRAVIPMLPEALSNELCSLKPKVDRLTLVCDMQVESDGEVPSYHFYLAIIRSVARLTYTEVADCLTQGVQHPQRKHLQALQQVFTRLLKARQKRGAIDLETIQTQIHFNSEGRIDHIRAITRNIAHCIIEECMLAANVCAARFLNQHKHPLLYRIHAPPSTEKTSHLREFLGSLGLRLAGGDCPDSTDYALLADELRKRPDASVLFYVLLRSMQQAQYSPDNIGHFGLAMPHYTHFTSPIRRYPDLLIHRAIKAVLRGTRHTRKDWQEIGTHCSYTERRADMASRDTENWLKCHYAGQHIGDHLPGIISSINSAGLTITLQNLWIEGFLPRQQLPHGPWQYDATRHTLYSRTGQRYRLGDTLTISIIRADPDSQDIELAFINA